MSADRKFSIPQKQASNGHQVFTLSIPEITTINLRKEGWLNWQILTALNNHVISYKANLHLKDIWFENEESYQQCFHQELD